MRLQGRNLTLNMRGPDVELLQKELRLLHQVIPPEETQFGKATRLAVLAIQQMAHLDSTGVVDERTATVINTLVDQLPRQPGTIAGSVTGASAAPLAGAQVQVLGTSITAVANAQGQYKLQNVPPGNVRLQAIAPGYQPQQAALIVAPGQAAVQNFALIKIANPQQVVRGRVSRDDGTPVPNAKVVAFQVAGAESQRVGESKSELDGRYEITYNAVTTPINLRVKAYDDSHEIGDSGVRKNVAPDQSGVDIVVATSAADFTVKGIVTRADGTPVVGAVVRAFDKDLRSEQLLGEARTEAAGRYEIRYSKAQFEAAEQGRADLVVRAFDANGQLLAASAVMFNAPAIAEIDLTLAPVTEAPTTLFERIATALNPLLDELKVTDLEEDADHQDVTFLANETGFDQDVLARFVLAYKLADEAVQPEFWFAVLGAELLPQDAGRSLAERLAAILGAVPGIGAASVRKALNRSFGAREIPEALRDQVPGWMEAFLQFVGHRSVVGDGQATFAKSSLEQAGIKDAQKQDRFGRLLNAHRPFSPAFLEALKQDASFTANEVAELHSSYRLADLTQGDFSVVKAIKEQFNVHKPEDVRSLAKRSEQEWVQLVESQVAAGQMRLPFPPETIETVNFPAATTYGRMLDRQFREAFPTAAFAGALDRAIRAGQVKGLKYAEQLNNVVQRHAEFEFLNTRIDAFLDNPTDPALREVATDPKFRIELKAVQRVFKLAPNFAATDALMADRVHSARQVYRMGETRFVQRYGTRPGFTPASARLAWNRAADTHAAVLTVVTDVQALQRDAQPQAMRRARRAMGDFPNWNNLFQTGDLCECEHCNSVLGPAAYFADLLMFLKDRVSANPPLTVKDILFRRRPDLGCLELNCDNALTPLPYVDVVCEVLEDVVAAGANDVELVGFVAVPADPAAAKAAVTAALSLAGLKFGADFSLSQVDPADPDRWVVHGDDTTYLLKKKATPNFFAEVLRNTKASAAELRAYPQYVNPKAYDQLKIARFPFSLPFDLFAEEVRAGFRQSNLQRWDLMRTLRGAAAPNNPTDSDIAAEYFDISVDGAAAIDEKRLILNAAATAAEQQVIWGETGNAGWLNTVAIVKAFLQKTGLEYNDLLVLLDLKFVNPGGNLAIQHNDASCDTAQKTIQALDVPALDRMHRFLRLWRKLKTWKMWELDLAIDRIGGGTLDASFLVQLFYLSEARVKLGPKVTVEQALALSGSLPVQTHFTTLYERREDGLYQSLFLNKRLGQPLDLAFAVASVDVAGPTAEKISGHEAVVLAALGLKEADLTILKGLTKASDGTAYITDDLTLSNLSFLWRHAWLAKVLKFKAAEWKIVLHILHSDVMAFANPQAAWDFLEMVKQLRDAGFTPDQLSWFLAADWTSKAAVREADAAKALTALRKDLQALEAQYGITPPTDADNLAVLLTSLLQGLNRDEDATQFFLATLRDDLSQAMPVAGLPAGFDFPDAIKHAIRIRYDEPVQILRFTGLMTAAEQTTLLNDPSLVAVTGIASYQSAVNALFDVPRLALKFFEPVFTTPLTTLPSAVDFGGLADQALTQRVWFDPERRVLRFSGIMTAAERDALLALSANAPYQTAVTSLFNQPRTIVPPDPRIWLTDVDLAFPLSSNLAQNFGTAVTKALAYLKQTLSERTVVDFASTQLGLTPAVAEFLLTRYNRLPATLLTQLATTFAATTGVVDYTTSKATFDAWFWAHRVATIWKKWKVSLDELEKILALTTNAQLLDFLTLPLDNAGALPSLERFLRSCRLIRTRDTLPETDVTLLEVLEKLNTAGYAAAADFAADVERLNDAWVAQDVATLTTSLNVAYPNEYLLAENWERLRRAMYFLDCLNTGAAKVNEFGAATMTDQNAATLKQLLRSKFGTETWLSLSGDIQDALRERKRDALSAYLLSQPQPADAPTGKWENTNDLYAYYLLDVEMCSCQLTSRLVQGSGSVQLFVQRCFMGLEPDVAVQADGATGDSAWRWWTWMRKYRVWEANRKVFLWPENWIEPELKRDRSSFFKDLEKELLQNEITQSTAEDAFKNYLEKLGAVAQLEIAGFYHEDDGSEAILHLFGRSPGAEPHTYYYRRYDYRQWTPWEKVDLDIPGDYLVPAVVNKRLFLFWPVFTEVAEKSDTVKVPPSPGSTSSTFTPDKSQKTLRLQLALSEYRDGKWTAKRVSTDGAESQPYDIEILNKFYQFFAIDRGEIDGRFGIQYSGSGDLTPSLYGAFDLSACKGAATLSNRLGYFISVTQPEGTSSGRPENQKWLELTNRSDQPDNDLTLWNPTFFIVRPPDTAVLNETPGLFRLSTAWQLSYFDKLWLNGILALGMNYGYDRSAPAGTWLPMFYNDQKRTFFVLPAVQLPSFVPPGTANGNGSNTGELVFYPKIKLYYRQWDVYFEGLVQTWADGFNLGALTQAQRAALEQALYQRFPEMFPPPYTDDQVRTLLKRVVMRYVDLVLGVWSVNLFQQSREFQFKNFYHPFVCEFAKLVYNPLQGIPGLMSRENQLRNSGFTFEQTYKPQATVIQAPTDPREADAYPDEVVDFSPDGAYSPYNWELFFHAPLLIANQLSRNQRFEEARDWYHFMFNPLGVESPIAGGSATSKYWITKPFFETTDPQYVQQRIDNILLMLAGDTTVPGYSAQAKQELEDQVRDWRNNPFEPHRIANYRTVAYQKTVVMKYLDNLIAWGDYLFRQDSMESINEATQLYVLAAEILGPRPRKVPARAKPPLETFNELEDKLDTFSNALIEVENLIPQPQGGNGNGGNAPPLPLLYFCIPRNDRMLGYWDIVSDRLYKIRHCMNIEGVVRQLSLFEPVLDPAALVKAIAGGVDIGAALADLNAPLPPYRFNVLLQKASEVCADVRGLGGALLAALEKKDAEELARLRQTQEVSLLEAVKAVRETQLAEAKETLEGLTRSRATVEERRNFYRDIEKVSGWETASMVTHGAAIVSEIVATVLNATAGAAHLVPQFEVGASGFGGSPVVTVKYGGENVGESAFNWAAFFGGLGGVLHSGANLMSTQAGNERRWDDWKLQERLADKELLQMDKQISAAELRVTIAEKELENHGIQIENAKAIDAYMRSKYTNEELYQWQIGQISGVYFTSYKLAYDLAKRAERCFRFELGLQDSNYISFGYWDSLKKGLMAGEQLQYDLRRLDAAYLDQHRREFELTKHISVALLDPLALVKLRETGRCILRLPEESFDLDYPGHYNRRIKSVSLTLPCVVGPYTTVSCTLRLLKNSVRISTANGDNGYPRNTDEDGVPAEDERFVESNVPVQAFATSSGQNDSGMFELNFHDDRYMPCENAGVISEWALELFTDLPANNPDPAHPDYGNPLRQFDYESIADVILHIKYTAKEDAGAFKNRVITHLREHFATDGGAPSLRMFNLRQEFPSQWQRFLKPENPANGNVFEFDMTSVLFPFKDANKTLTINEVWVLARCADANDYTVQLTPADPGQASNFAIKQLPDYRGLHVADHDSSGETIEVKQSAAKWALKMSRPGGGNLTEDPNTHKMEVEDVVIVVGYTAPDGE